MAFKQPYNIMIYLVLPMIKWKKRMEMTNKVFKRYIDYAIPYSNSCTRTDALLHCNIGDLPVLPVVRLFSGNDFCILSWKLCNAIGDA